MRLTLLALVAACMLGGATVSPEVAGAQSLFEWERRPSFEDERRRQREGERRSRAQRRADYCRKLEQRLVQEWRRTNDTRSELPQIRGQMEEVKKKFRAAKAKAERAQCYEESFFFGRSLRRTPQCVKLDRAVRQAQRQYEDLKHQAERISRSGSARSRQDDLIAELARYGCGEDYERQYEARRPTFFSFFDDRGPGVRERQRRAPSDLPFSTYRTMCVRQCDGYYFPVSFSTLPSQFAADEAQCTERCAAPTELFVYRNPGEDVEQMVSLNGKPYSELDIAWLYRKKFIDGCSCDASEYSEADIAKARQELESAEEALPQDPDIGRAEDQSGAQGETGKRAQSDRTAEDEPIIRDKPEDDSFDPRQR